MSLASTLKKIGSKVSSTVKKAANNISKTTKKVVQTIADKSSAIVQTVSSVATGNVIGTVTGLASIVTPSSNTVKVSNNAVSSTVKSEGNVKKDNWKTTYKAYTKVLNN